MKRWFRLFIISTVSLWVVNQWLPEGLVISNGLITLFKAGLALAVANFLVRPILSIIMLPINLLTFGIFRWVTNVLLLWLVVKFVPQISIQPFSTAAWNYNGLIIPALSFNWLTSWIAISLVISLVAGFLIWLSAK